MTKNVLFVDDDRILRRLIQKKFEKHKDTFCIITAEDGLDAVKRLEEHTISLVSTDLQMPNMDGFSLLALLSEKYPDIPVIVLTGHSTPKAKKIAKKRGAVGYIEKPFKVEELAQKIKAILEKESEGGILQTIPLEMFLQLIEMEQKTCTLRVFEKKSDKLGVLFFREGDLLDARFRGQHGKAAAYEIFSWDKVTLSIQDECSVNQKKIDEDLQAILFDTIRMKDEASEGEKALKEDPDEDALQLAEEVDEDEELMFDVPETVGAEIDNEDTEPEDLPFEDMVRIKLDKLTKGKKWQGDIYTDNSWKKLVTQAIKIGKFLKTGALKACYINRDEATNLALLPGEDITVVSVDPKFPRDKLLEVLSQ
jgi:CheY-like chemotaxis protein